MLPPKNRLKLPLPSSLVRQQGMRFHSALVQAIVITSTENQDQPARFAVQVSKRLDKRATRRNRTRRKILAALIDIIGRCKTGIQVIIIAKQLLWDTPQTQVEQDILQLCQRAKLLK